MLQLKLFASSQKAETGCRLYYPPYMVTHGAEEVANLSTQINAFSISLPPRHTSKMVENGKGHN